MPRRCDLLINVRKDDPATGKRCPNVGTRKRDGIWVCASCSERKPPRQTKAKKARDLKYDEDLSRWDAYQADIDRASHG